MLCYVYVVRWIMVSLLYLDVETTGLYPYKHVKDEKIAGSCEIIQIAYIYELNGKVIDKKNYNIKPNNWDSIYDKALEVNKTTLEDLKRYPDSSSVFKKIYSDFMRYKAIGKQKLIMVGHNIDFDKEFIMSFFESNNKKKMVFGIFDLGMSQCTMKMAATARLRAIEKQEEIGYKRVGLEKVATGLGIDVSDKELHSAMYDTEVCRLIFHNLINYEDSNEEFMMGF